MEFVNIFMQRARAFRNPDPEQGMGKKQAAPRGLLGLSGLGRGGLGGGLDGVSNGILCSQPHAVRRNDRFLS